MIAAEAIIRVAPSADATYDERIAVLNVEYAAMEHFLPVDRAGDGAVSVHIEFGRTMPPSVGAAVQRAILASMEATIARWDAEDAAKEKP